MAASKIWLDFVLKNAKGRVFSSSFSFSKLSLRRSAAAAAVSHTQPSDGRNFCSFPGCAAVFQPQPSSWSRNLPSFTGCAAVSRPQPSGSRKFSSFLGGGGGGGGAIAVADQLRLSSPRLMLPPEEEEEEEEEEEVATTDAGSGGEELETKLLNLRFWTLAEDDHHRVVELKAKVPQPLLYAHCVGSSHGWLGYINYRDCRFYLANLFRNHGGSDSSSPPEEPVAEIIALPSFLTLPGVLRAVNKTRPDDPSHIDHFVLIDFYNRIATWELDEPKILAQTYVRRMALSSAPNNINNGDDDCVVVIVHHFVNQELAFCRLSSSSASSSWSPLDSPLRRKDYGGFCDVIYSKRDQLFYALSNSGVIEAWDLNDPSSTPKMTEMRINYTDPPPLTTVKGMKCGYRGYLVESPSSLGGNILLVLRRRAGVSGDGKTLVEYSDLYYPYKTVKFDIWKLDFERRTGEYLDNLGDTALFLGFNHSFALSTTGGEFPELKPNSVYFADDTHPDVSYVDPYEGNDMGIYHLDDQTVTPLLHASSFELEEILPRPIWIAPAPNP